MKGISEAIAMLLMIVITLGIIGTIAYFLTGVTKQFIVQVTDNKCDVVNNRIDLVLQAQGNTAGRRDTDFSVSVRGISATISYYTGIGCNNIDNIGGTNCNTPLASGGTVNPGEYIGVRITGGTAPNNFVAGKSYEIRIFSSGRTSSIFVSC